MAARVILTILRWFRIWRWPAGVVAGLLLWIALVAVVGATTRPTGAVGESPAEIRTVVPSEVVGKDG